MAVATLSVNVSPVHQRRLREIWRSAGWPCQDLIEAELLAAGLLERVRHGSGHETLRVTDAGVAVLAGTLQRNRARREAHEALVERVAREMTRAGRMAWRGLALRAHVDESADGGAGRWVMALPDVFSIRHTTVEDWLEPAAHEIKVTRADLLSDLRHPHKRHAYLAMSSQCWYVLKEGIAEPGELPPEFGVMFACADGTLDVARPAPKRALRLPLATWMALARTNAEPGLDGEAQAWLRDAA
ncbi:hypothetical protein [uncultured Piscinibacter sp.]|uniref:hypothetical protein n=1 Tax=uncultured Piscinibacter sp. TaxID=1131835 RepID=UPI00261AC81E|nr:hypothetical protein [uncultured Piscinibacter sp.]